MRKYYLNAFPEKKFISSFGSILFLIMLQSFSCNEKKIETTKLFSEESNKEDKISTCDWCNSNVPVEEAFFYIDWVSFHTNKQSGPLYLDSMFLSSNKKGKLYFTGKLTNEWVELNKFKLKADVDSARWCCIYDLPKDNSILYNLTTSFDFVKTDSMKDDQFYIEGKNNFEFCSLKCMNEFNEEIKLNKPINTRLLGIKSINN